MRLLEHGYSVRTTVRFNQEHKRDVSFLTNLPVASERLEISYADLNDPESFDPAIAGCTGVFHVATSTYKKLSYVIVSLS
ncbi:Dihydroflavonol-4-reductase [Melia azedarach]|uniref:Dihydroflavonol-4-reductase n=1 Tax=Melia azedarach TaxID=155640 RepID=A0ACC1YVR8_MELAZ|nr:Dihydroflavonol-4-reductase [Melia azedarach]